MIDTRTALVRKLREQKEQVEQELARATGVMQEFGTKAKQVQAKIALVKAGERIQALKTAISERIKAAAPTSLDDLDRDLDRRLQEHQERTRMDGEMNANDTYI
jgi:hypothetical protein